MTPIQMEAESHKYGPSVRLILPLSDGSWAVFDHRRALWLIISEPEPAIKKFLDTLFPYVESAKDPGRVALEQFVKELDLGDLDL